MKYILIDIGCIECGEPSNLIGVYNTKKEAKQIENSYINTEAYRWGRPEWRGQHSLQVFEYEN